MQLNFLLNLAGRLDVLITLSQFYVVVFDDDIMWFALMRLAELTGR